MTGMRRLSVQGVAHSLIQIALVLLQGTRATVRARDLIPQHLGEGRKLLRIGPGRGIPQARADEGLRTMQVRLLHLHTHGDAWLLPPRGELAQYLAVTDDGGPPVDAEGIAPSGHEEDHAHVGVLDDVAEAVDAVVTGP